MTEEYIVRKKKDKNAEHFPSRQRSSLKTKEMQAYRRTLRIPWTEHALNVEVLKNIA